MNQNGSSGVPHGNGQSGTTRRNLLSLASITGEFVREMRLAAAIHWYARGEISQEKAAQIAALDRTDFLLALARERVDAFALNFADLKRGIDRG